MIEHFTFREDERYSFALGQPYSYQRYEIYLETLVSNNFEYFQVETLSHTIQNRPLKVLTITDPKNLKVLATDEVKPKVIVVMGRYNLRHSWVLGDKMMPYCCRKKEKYVLQSESCPISEFFRHPRIHRLLDFRPRNCTITQRAPYIQGSIDLWDHRYHMWMVKVGPFKIQTKKTASTITYISYELIFENFFWSCCKIFKTPLYPSLIIFLYRVFISSDDACKQTRKMILYNASWILISIGSVTLGEGDILKSSFG